ncbi:MAG: cardiolipin synthase ClsB [Thiobacillaceae bacterium]|nr:cardiolipin synthase ClsB [Thiobacillaceae bacterium]
MSGALTEGNRLVLLESGGEYFPALLAAIEAARHEVWLESYIFRLDEIGRQVVEALVRAARRGVRVRVLLDGFGSRHFPREVARGLRREGVQLLFYRPELGLLRLRRYRLRRLHRKLALIDARVGFVGGINVIDDRNAGSPDHPAYDFAVQVEGPVVADIWQAMQRLWWLVRWSRLGRRPRQGKGLPPCTEAVGGQAAQFLTRDNLRHRRDIEQAYLDAIDAARSEIILANAYFLPGRRFRRALVRAAARGVRVVLLMQGYTDHPFYKLAARALYRRFLDHGVEIREYHAGFLHAKVAVVDDDWATVGSSNIDPFSLLLSREANLVVRDVHFTAQLRARLMQAIAQGTHRIHHQTLRRIPWYGRLASWLVYNAVRIGTGLTGYARGEA